MNNRKNAAKKHGNPYGKTRAKNNGVSSARSLRIGHTHTAIHADINLIELVEVKQGDDFTEILRFTAGFE
jgi:hypothetical protein